MATFVLVHGALGGGWQWQGVARRLANHRHEVYRVTLTGLGERSHLLTPEVDLDTHIQDVLGVLQWEDLDQVLLCAHSYGGMVITGVADRMPERLARLVYIDAMVPQDGQSANQLVGPQLAELGRTSAREQGDGWRVPHDTMPRLTGVPPEVADWYAARLSDQPLRALEQPVRLTGRGAAIPRTYIRCSLDPERGVMLPFAEHARAQGWDYHLLATDHDAEITDPGGLAALLNDVAVGEAQAGG
jgi:pimeloyl-ACP methyl ester carboxylesterase